MVLIEINITAVKEEIHVIHVRHCNVGQFNYLFDTENSIEKLIYRPMKY